jgi:hypothetical protein
VASAGWGAMPGLGEGRKCRRRCTAQPPLTYPNDTGKTRWSSKSSLCRKWHLTRSMLLPWATVPKATCPKAKCHDGNAVLLPHNAFRLSRRPGRNSGRLSGDAAWGAANRDPRQYDDPDVFRADRNPTGHLAFGSGIHFCLGAQLARMQAKAVLCEIVDNVDRIEMSEPPSWSTNTDLCELTRLEVRVTRRATVSCVSRG